MSGCVIDLVTVHDFGFVHKAEASESNSENLVIIKKGYQWVVNRPPIKGSFLLRLASFGPFIEGSYSIECSRLFFVISDVHVITCM